MIENGLYVVKRDILNIIISLGGDCDINSGDKRPVFCCVKDKKSNDYTGRFQQVIFLIGMNHKLIIIICAWLVMKGICVVVIIIL